MEVYDKISLNIINTLTNTNNNPPQYKFNVSAILLFFHITLHMLPHEIVAVNVSKIVPK
jgi:hypothetical protein